MKIAVVGCSGHNPVALHCLRSGGHDRVVAAAPGSEGEDMSGLLATQQKRGHDVKLFADYRRMLDDVKPDVLVSNPWFGDNGTVVKEALLRDCHVFAEKPLTTELHDLAALESILHNNPALQVAMMTSFRYQPEFYSVWRAVQAGMIGQPRLLTAQKSYKLGNRADFYRRRASYGGTIPWVASHAVDWVLWLSSQRFRSVYAVHSCLGNRNHGELEATSLCLFNMSDEVAASVSADYLQPSTAEQHGDDRIRVAGTRGVLEVRAGKASLVSETGAKLEELEPADDSSIFSFFPDFLDQIEGRGKCRVSRDDAIETTRACLLARQSADTGRVVFFPGSERIDS